MIKKLIVFLAISLLSFSLSANLKYSLLNVDCQSNEEMKTLISRGFDVITVSGIKNNQVKVVATTDDIIKLENFGYHYDVIYDDFVAFQQSRLTQPAFRNLQIGQGSMGGYFTDQEIEDFVDSLYTHNSDIMSQPISIGETHEERPIYAYKISDNPEVDESEPEVLIIGLHHAREPMSIIAALYFTQWLLDNYGNDELADYLVNEREIWLSFS